MEEKGEDLQEFPRFEESEVDAAVPEDNAVFASLGLCRMLGSI